jgi:drug/metabolite transporter (DMT)-like permease
MEEGRRGKHATLIGFSAILLWGMLALLTSLSGDIPPFQLTAMAFGIAFLMGAAAFIKGGCDFSLLKQPFSVWLNGIFGLFGYHAVYFLAMKNAPPIDASLINYLWPILIVLFSAALPGERLRWFHLGGVALGFLGVATLLLRGGFEARQEYSLGYGLALACAVIWAAYSVLSRKLHGAPTLLIGAYCGIAALLSLICHLLFESTAPVAGAQWIPVIFLGLGPMGLAFFTWDHGMKKGNIKLLGTLSYAAPLLSSGLLIAFGKAELTPGLILACGLITLGSLLSALDRLKSMLIKR